LAGIQAVISEGSKVQSSMTTPSDGDSQHDFKRFQNIFGKAQPRVSSTFFQRLAVSERDLQSDRT
jgi:hypothetical protein